MKQMKTIFVLKKQFPTVILKQKSIKCQKGTLSIYMYASHIDQEYDFRGVLNTSIISPSVTFQILNWLAGCKYKIYNMTEKEGCFIFTTSYDIPRISVSCVINALWRQMLQTLIFILNKKVVVMRFWYPLPQCKYCKVSHNPLCSFSLTFYFLKKNFVFKGPTGRVSDLSMYFIYNLLYIYTCPDK